MEFCLPSFFQVIYYPPKESLACPSYIYILAIILHFLRKFIHFTNVVCIICLVPAWWTKDYLYSDSRYSKLCAIESCFADLFSYPGNMPYTLQGLEFHLTVCTSWYSQTGIFWASLQIFHKVLSFFHFYHFTFLLIFLLFNLFFSRSPIGQLFFLSGSYLCWIFLAITLDGMKLFFTPF